MSSIISVNKISGRDFHENFVKTNTPVVIRKMTSDWNALKNWNANYFKKMEGDSLMPLKTGDVSKGKREKMPLSDYVTLLEDYEAKIRNGENPTKPPYLHDVPIFHLLPNLKKDIEPFPIELFPKWYWDNWQNYIQFFMGSTGSLTPLHFDTLLTHNLFFQVAGSKKFILIPPEQKDKCYIEGWRWAKFDPSKPDYSKFPAAADVQPSEVILNAGDILFMPAGTLHQVHGLSYSISFNIDWHTPTSAFSGLTTLFKGAPLKNAFYNSLIFLGLNLKIPAKVLFPYYKSYLNYVS